MKIERAVCVAFALVALAAAIDAAKNPIVGGQEMFPSKNIVQNAVNSADHTTLVAAVKAAGLVDTLQGTGPFTVFAPTNAAFDKLPAGTVRHAAQTGEQSDSDQGAHLPRGGRPTLEQGPEAANQGGSR